MSTKDEVLDILYSVKKENFMYLIKFLTESTFFTDPASAVAHNNYEGGLAEHSLNVYKNLNRLCKDLPEYEKYLDSLKIIGLLHDVSLIGTFQKSNKNIPLKDSSGKNKKDDRGKIVFIEKEVYENYLNNSNPYPQGHLSTIILKKYIKLSLLEDISIFWNQNFINNEFLLNRAQKMSKIILYTFFADMEARLIINE